MQYQERVAGKSWIVLSLSVSACGLGDLGDSYGYAPRCEGAKIRCTPPAEYVVIEPERTGELFTGELPALNPEWALSLECGAAPFIGGAGSSVWVFCNADEGRTLIAKQFDASGHVGDHKIEAPEGLVGDDMPPTFLFFAKQKGPEGPSVGLEWSVKCTKPDEYACIHRELVRFTNDVHVPPVRLVLSEDAPGELWAGSSTPMLIEPESGDALMLGITNLNWTAARLDTEGHVMWSQQAFPENFLPVSAYRGPSALAKQTLSVLGTLETGDLALIDVEINTGNLTARTFSFAEDSSAKIVRDAGDRLVVAHGDSQGNLHLVRFDDAGPKELMLYREDYTLLSAIDLDVDAQGGSYVLTMVGSATAPVPSVCRVSDTRDIVCAALPDAWAGELDLAELGLAELGLPNARIPQLTFASVSDDGSLYTLSKDAELLRYRLPEVPTP